MKKKFRKKWTRLNVIKKIFLYIQNLRSLFFQDYFEGKFKKYVPVDSNFKESWTNATKSIKNDRSKENKSDKIDSTSEK